MSFTKKIRPVVFLVLAAVLRMAPAIHAEMDLSLPEGTQFYLYIRDVKNFEDNLRRAGLLKLSSDYVDFFIDYAKDKQPVLGFYRELKEMEDGHFLKSLAGDVAILKILNDALIVLTVEKNSSYFPRLMELVGAKGAFNGYFVDFQGDRILLSRNKATLSFYKAAAGRKSPEAVLNNFVTRDMDLLYYKTGADLMGSWLDPFLVGVPSGTGKKSLSVALNLKKKAISIFTSPRLYKNNGQRMRFNGQVVQSSVLSFWDTLQNPYDVFKILFGAGSLEPFEKDFRKNFENQISIALVDLTPDIRPSFFLVAKPAGGRFAEAEKTFMDFVRTTLGEQSLVKRTVGALDVKFGENTGFYLYTIAGMFVLSDSRVAVESSAAVFAGKSPSVWDIRENAKLKDLTDKPSAVFLNLSGLADSLYASMLKTMTLTSAQKDHLKNYVKTVGELGSLVGYGEDHRDYNYFYFVLK